MEKIKEKLDGKIYNNGFVIIASLKNGRKKIGDIVHKTEEGAHRHWKNLCKFVPMQMEKYIGYEVRKLKQ